MKELNRIVTVEYGVNVTQLDGSSSIHPCSSLNHAEAEKERLSAVPLIGEPLKAEIVTRTKVTVINATIWESI